MRLPRATGGFDPTATAPRSPSPQPLPPCLTRDSGNDGAHTGGSCCARTARTGTLGDDILDPSHLRRAALRRRQASWKRPDAEALVFQRCSALTHKRRWQMGADQHNWWLVANDGPNNTPNISARKHSEHVDLHAWYFSERDTRASLFCVACQTS